jgi:N-acetyltransferase
MMEPLVLEGVHVRLVPLSMDHVPALLRVALDPEIWRWTSDSVATDDDLRSWVRSALDAQRGGNALPFTTLERASGRAVGSTRFGNYEAAHGRVEIGWTWVAPAWQRTPVNTEAKLLMLRHAFETLELRRVELKTDALNTRSRNAILRLGAREEGTLRAHTATDRGRVRDTVYHSILRDEWPDVRDRLEARLRPAG